MRSASLVIAAMGLLVCVSFVTSGCSSSNGASKNSGPNLPAQAADRGTGAGGNAAARPEKRGLAVKVVWEALAHERYLHENPRFGRRPGTGSTPMRIVLVNESHPEAEQIRRGSTDSEEGTGVVSDQEMLDLVAGLKKIKFFESAKPTDSQTQLFDHSQARGRVTVDDGSTSWTLLSMRGQGMQEHTKHIPAIYSQVKQAVAMLRNRSTSLTVTTSNE